MVALPQELIQYIIEDAYYHYPQGWAEIDRQTLKACSLVSSEWRGHSQRLLFHEVRQGNLAFLNELRAETPMALLHARSIRRLDVMITSQSSHDRYRSVDDLILLLTHCKAVYELTLRKLDTIHSLTEETMDRLRQMSLHSPLATIAALNLESFGIQSPIPYQLLSVMPSVRHLRLGNELGAPRPTSLCTVKLYELAVLRTPSSPHNLEWLLSQSKGHLRILEFKETPGRSFQNLLAEHGPHLLSFRLMWHTQQAAPVFEHFSSLRELVIYQFSDFLRLAKIPKTVKHVSFRYLLWAKNATLLPILAVIDELPELEIVSFNKEVTTHVHFPELQYKCHEKGVQLRLDAPPLFVVRTSPRRIANDVNDIPRTAR
ncbi:hypothetical protein K474DRAFT_1669866 [Panus rudis PR-1116 ss-1]|nr:hypothetical protein K474DRAFT_1669866 [Panus rudis PR-1116 ss-1]